MDRNCGVKLGNNWLQEESRGMRSKITANCLRAAGIPAVLMAMLASTGAIASAAEEEAEDENRYIEEVIVTASKREVNLQDSSLAITAYTGEQLDSRGIREVTDIAAAIPGIDMAESVPTESILIIRSMSNNGRGYHRAEVWRQQTNTSYLDDVVLFPGITPLKMVDLERMEVLKGPQGTLFGKSAMAGLVRFVSNKPNPEAFSGNLTASYDTVAGGGNGNSLEGYVNVPLSDSFAVRLTGYRYDLPGFIDVVGVRPQNDADTENTAGYRLRARWDVGDSMFLEASLINQTTEVGDVGKPMATWEPSQETDIHAIQLTAFDPEDPKRQWRGARGYRGRCQEPQIRGRPWGIHLVPDRREHDEPQLLLPQCPVGVRARRRLSRHDHRRLDPQRLRLLALLRGTIGTEDRNIRNPGHIQR